MMNREPLQMTQTVTLNETVTIGRGQKRRTIPAGDYRLGCMGLPTLEYLPEHEKYGGNTLGFFLQWSELEKLHESGVLVNKQ